MSEPAVKRESVLRTKSYGFSVRIVKLSQVLVSDHREYVLSRQILRSGTATILKDTGYLDERLFQSLSADCVELIKMLIATVKTTQPK